MKIGSLCGAVAVLLLGAVFASPMPDLSGTWLMDRDRSFGIPAGMSVVMTLEHKDDRIHLNARMTTADGERTVEETWVVDGQEREFSPATAAQGAKGKRKAYWLPDNRRLVVADETVTTGPKGTSTEQLMRKYTLSADGDTLTVDYYIDRPTISGESKRVFVRKK
jgi:hypothetical protein